MTFFTWDDQKNEYKLINFGQRGYLISYSYKKFSYSQSNLIEDAYKELQTIFGVFSIIYTDH